MGYSPNPAARALRSRKSHIVGAVIPTLDYAIYARMVNAFQQGFSEHGYMTIVLTTGFDNRHIFEQVKLLVERGAEALLLVGAVEDSALRKFLKESVIPVVTTYSYLSDTIPSIGFDNYAAMRRIMDHLIYLGHREFALVSGMPDGNDRQRSRIEAYKAALSNRRFSGADRIFSHSYTIEYGAAAMRDIYKAYPDTTAVVCTADILAFGVLTECKRLGLRVPTDISVTGFDDAEYAARLDPPLSSISVPANEMGRAAASELYLALTENRKPKPIKLETSLVVRESSGSRANPKMVRLSTKIARAGQR
jgi:LacI family transcriptional regulator